MIKETGMPKEKLKQSLSRLNDEITHLSRQDDSQAEKLAELHGQASAYLRDGSRIGPDAHHTLLQELREAAERFEVSHPGVTDGINQVLSALSNMGI